MVYVANIMNRLGWNSSQLNYMIIDLRSMDITQNVDAFLLFFIIINLEING